MMFRPAPLTGRENSFGAIRLFAALLVIYGHGEDMRGVSTPSLWSRPVSQIGLDLFFCISGYLIYDSWLRDQRFDRFLAKRALRILPGLVACVVFCIALVGPLATALPLATYFAHHGTWQFLLNIALYLKLYLPGVFQHRLLGGAVNGSFWSLLPEILCYLTVPLICLASRRLRGVALLAMAAFCGGISLYMFAYQPTGYSLIYGADPKYVLAEVPFFMAGAFWRQVQVRVPGLLRLDVAVLMCAATFVVPAAFDAGSVPLRWLTLSYTVIAFGMTATPVLRSAMRLGDLSYGAYLYAFPVQQFALDYVDSILLPTLVTFGLAFLSWHLIEQPALRWKPGTSNPPQRDVPPGGAADWIDWLSLIRRTATRTPLLPAIAALTCLGLFAARLGAGKWHEADYVLFGALQVGDWTTALPALLSYPVRGLILASYGSAALAAHTAGLVSALAMLWTTAIVLTGLAIGSALPGRPALVAALSVAPFAFVLATTGPVDWPTAASGTLPTVAAMTALWFLVGTPSAPWRVVMMVLAAGCSSAGAGLVLGLSAAMLFVQWPGRRAAGWIILPGLFAVFVLIAAPLGRIAAPYPAVLLHPGALLVFALGFGAMPQAIGLAPASWRQAVILGSSLLPAFLAGFAAGEVTLAALAVALALALVARAIPWRVTGWAPAALALAFYPALTTGMRQPDTQMAIEARQRTWTSGRRLTPAMEFYLPPEDATIFGLPPGTYENASALGPVSRLFGKSVITVCFAWQQSESWLIDGRFVPSCPPRDGPPDRIAKTRP